MKKFREFKSQQQVVNEIGPIGATMAAAMGVVGGSVWLYKQLKKFKGYRENRADKKVRERDGFDMKIKVYNPTTGKEEEQEFYIDPKEGNKDLEKATGGAYPKKSLTGKIKAPTDDDLDKMEKDANRKAKRQNSKIKRKIKTGDIDSTSDELTTDQQAALVDIEDPPKEPTDAPPEDEKEPTGDGETDTSTEPEVDPEQELKSKGDKQPEDGGITDDGEANDYLKLVGKAPAGWKMDWVNPKTKKSKQLFKKAELEKRKEQDKNKDSKGFVKTSTGSRKVYNSRVLKFGEFIKEDVMKDMRKISKSKKDMEIKLDDGTEIPIDPMTAEIFVKYIEGLKSSEQKKVINQIQRTERGFMKVLGKAHGE